MSCGLGSSGRCCSGSGGLSVSIPTARESLDLQDMRDPIITPSIKNRVILNISLAILLCEILVMVIWLYVALVEGPSRDEVSNPSSLFSRESSKNWHSSLYGILIVKCSESWLDGLCSVKLHRSSISSEY